MALKVRTSIPPPQHWERYWTGRTVDSHFALCETDDLLPIFRRHLPRRGRILEAGCGLGKWVRFLAQEGYTVVGADAYVPALAAYAQVDGRTPLAGADVTRLPFADDSFVAYLSLGVVEHFEQGPRAPLCEARRVLQPDGIAIIEVPCLNALRRCSVPLRQLVRRLRRRRGAARLHFAECWYARPELEAAVRACGFEVVCSLPKDDVARGSIGLAQDFPRLLTPGVHPPQLRPWGKRLARCLNAVSPWMITGMVVCVARAKK